MKICGRNNECFERGPQWGHFEGVICNHASEKTVNKKQVSMCGKTKELTRVYTTAKEYADIKNQDTEIMTNPETTKTLQPLITHAKTEFLRLLIEVYRDGFTVLYCDKSRKREFLKQIRLNKIKTRIKIITHGYDIQFPEVPKLTELGYIRGRVIKRFGRKRIIRTYSNHTPQLMYNVVTVDFPEVENQGFVKLMRDIYFVGIDNLKLVLVNNDIIATVNRDRDTFIVYYGG